MQEYASRRARDRRASLRSGNGATRGARVAAALAALVVLVTAVVVLVRDPGPVQGALTQSVRPATVLAEGLHAGVEVHQPLHATQDGLTRVSATFGTFGGRTCAIDVVVTDDTGRTIHAGTVACTDLVDNGASVVASFNPVPDSAGRTFTVTYRSSATPDDAVTMHLGEPEGVVLPARVTGPGATTAVPDDRPLATATVAEYDAGPAAAQIALALERAAYGAPWWGQPAAVIAWVVLGLVAGVAALALAGRRTRTVVVAVAVLALCRGLVWATVIPTLEGMDEAAHVAYAQFVAETGELPRPGEWHDGSSDFYSPQIVELEEFRNRLDLPPGDRAPWTDDAQRALDAALAQASPASNGAAPAAGYPPGYYLPAAAAYALTPGDLDSRIHGMRLWSVALGVLAAVLTLVAAQRLLPGRGRAAVLLAVAVSLQPVLAHQLAIVNNDALVVAAGAGAFATALAAARGRTGLLAGLAGGAWVGLALLGKPFGIGLLPVVVAGLVCGAVTARRGLGGAVRTLLASAGGLAAGLAATYGAWVAAQRVLGIGAATLPPPDGQVAGRGLGDYLHLQLRDRLALSELRWSQQLFGRFAWLDVLLPAPAYRVLWVALLLVAAAACVWVVLQLVRLVAALVRRAPARAWDARTSVTWTALALVVGTFGALLAAGYLSFRNDGNDGLLQGRYALMALPGLLALPVLTSSAWLVLVRHRTALAPAPLVATDGPDAPRRAPTVVVDGSDAATPRWDVTVLAVVAVGMWTLHVLALAALVDRFYL